MADRNIRRRLLAALRGTADRLKRLSRKLWVRIIGIAALALLASGMATLVGPYLPEALEGLIRKEAVENLLDSISSSMLAVTIFSLSVMVSVHRAAEGNWTPRIHRLLAQDNVTLTAISVFLGGWLYALAARILLDATLIGSVEHVFLFFMTVLVVLLIVVVVMRWVAHLSGLGSLMETGGRLEQETRAAFELRAQEPCLGGHPLLPESVIPETARPVRAPRTGWITNIDGEALNRIGAEAEGAGTPVYVLAPIGAFVARGDEIARVAGPKARQDEAAEAFGIGELRSFYRDPGYGLLVMSEVAQRALSPGVNDPGTAIEILGRMLRALEAWVPETEAAQAGTAKNGEADTGASGAPSRPHLWAPPLAAGPLVQSAFLPIARDGAGSVEVALATIATLDRLARHHDAGMAAAARSASDSARDRARRTLDDPVDLERLRLGPEAPDAAPSDSAGPARPMVREAV